MRNACLLSTVLGVPADSKFAASLKQREDGFLPLPVREGSDEYREYCQILRRFAIAGRPAGGDTVSLWLATILAGTKAGSLRDQSELEARVRAVTLALVGKPFFLFSVSKQKEILLKYEFFPTAAEIWREMEKDYLEFERLRAHLDWLIGRKIGAPLPTEDELKQLAPASPNAVQPVKPIS